MSNKQTIDGAAALTNLMRKITLTLWSSGDVPNIRKSFTGRWLVGDEEDGERADDDRDGWDAGAEWSVALTRQGKLVVYYTHCNDKFAPVMDIYADFAELRADDTLPENVVAAAAAALGLDFETELDI